MYGSGDAVPISLSDSQKLGGFSVLAPAMLSNGIANEPWTDQLPRQMPNRQGRHRPEQDDGCGYRSDGAGDHTGGGDACQAIRGSQRQREERLHDAVDQRDHANPQTIAQH